MIIKLRQAVRRQPTKKSPMVEHCTLLRKNYKKRKYKFLESIDIIYRTKVRSKL